MASRAKRGVAAAMMLFVLATAPAVLCVSYMAQNTQAHSCCPKPASDTVTPTCCIHAPAVTSQSVDVSAPSVAIAQFHLAGPMMATASIEAVPVIDLDTSPPPCSSILRV